MEEQRYIEIMLQSLEKKKKILELIGEKNKAQSMLLMAESYDDAAIEENIREKGDLIEQLSLLDEGFERVYERIREPLINQKEQYRQQILKMQELIRDIMEKSTLIQSQEARNKTLAKQYFSYNEENVARARTHKKVSNAYRSVMMGAGAPDAQFLDKKK